MIKNDLQFNLVEAELKKWAETKFEQGKAGQWVTKLYLQNQEGWSKILG